MSTTVGVGSNMRGLLDLIEQRRRGAKNVFGTIRLFAFVAAAAALMLFVPASSLAVHDTGLFELDGNAVTQPAVPGNDDWDRVCHQVQGGDCSTTSNTTGAVAANWTDDGALNSTIFTGGGSKDPQDIPDW